MLVRKKILLIATVGLLYACGSSTEKSSEESEVVKEPMEETTSETEEPETYPTAKATLSSASGSEVSGEATFSDLGDGTVSFKLTLTNATPGPHAVHLHQNGDCSAADATSAGGHWNPSEDPHGKRSADMEFHAGDIDNLEVGEDGTGTLEMTIEGWSIGGADSTNIVNKAVIIHAGADDFTSQPSGAAGARVACGVIEMN